MHQRGGKTVTSSDDGGPANVLDPQHNHPDCPRFNEWIDPTSDATDTEVSHLVSVPSKKVTKNHQKRCCRNSTSSGYSSQSPPLSAGSYYTAACCTNSGITKNSLLVPHPPPPPPPPPPPHRHHHHHSTSRHGGGSQNQQIIGPPSLAVIHEAETIPRPIWPFMGDDIRSIGDPSAAPPARCEMIDCEIGATRGAHENCKQNFYPCCDYCRAYCSSSYGYRDSCVDTATAESSSSSSAREVLLELSRTLNSVIEAESDLNAEEILRDISITVARSINHQPKNDQTASVICEQDYTYRLSSSSSSAGGKESSVNVNPVNLRVYGKPKWLHVPASSRSSSQCCPYEVKTLLAAAQKASRTVPAYGENTRAQQKTPGSSIAPAVFLVPQGNCIYPTAPTSAYRASESRIAGCDAARPENPGSGHFDGGSSKRVPTSIGRLNGRPAESCGEKCSAGEPVYSTQLDGSDESSSYGAIGDSSAKNGWTNESSKVFDRHLDFTLDGNRAERLGRAIAKAKRKRQWCRGLTAIFGLVFFVLSVVIVSLSVTRGRKVFGSM